MARTDTLGNFLTDVAEAIRTKKGTSETIQASQFDTEIANLPSGSDLDWSAIGYDSTPQSIVDGYNYAKEIYDSWDSSVTSLDSKYSRNTKLVYFPLVDTSNITTMEYTFNYCTRLKEIALINTSNVTSLRGAFTLCNQLTYIPVLNTSKLGTMKDAFNNVINLNDNALDNILQMCINATSYTGTKTLSAIGISSTTYPVSRIETLPHYQDFINAGWTIGY